MNDIKFMEELRNNLSALQHQMDMNKLGVITISSQNNINLSVYHKEFDNLIKKYTGFADNYKNELNNFRKSLSNKLNELHKERELEIISNCSVNGDNEIMFNSSNDNNSSAINSSYEEIEDTNYSSSPSINIDECKVPTKPLHYVSPTKPLHYVSPTKPLSKHKNNHTIQSKPKNKPKNMNKNKSVGQPKNNKNMFNKKNMNKMKQNNMKNKKNIKKTNKNIPRKIEQQNKNKINTENVPKVVQNDNEEKKQENNNFYQSTPYQYDEKRVNFKFNSNGKATRSSTVIYIGNLPKEITIPSVQWFVKNNFKILMSQVEETKIKNGSKGCYALVRIRNDVSFNKVNRMINNINYLNSKEYAELLKKKNKDKKKINHEAKSWQKRVYIKFNNNFWYYSSEEEMLNDSFASDTLYVRNFDILNKECHKELTHKFLEHGNLSNDIEIYTDKYGDPYCIVQFDNKYDAIFCCNSVINFYGRTLDCNYSRNKINL